MKNIVFVTALFMLFSVFASVQYKGGKFNAAVIAPDAAATVKYAAKEWCSYVEKTTKSKVRLYTDGKLRKEPAVYIGFSEAVKSLKISADKIKPEGFIIKTLPSAIVMLGNDYRGKLPITGFRDPWNSGAVWNKKLQIGAFGDAGSLNAVYHFLHEYLGVCWYMPGNIGEVIQKKEVVNIPDIDIAISPEFSYRYPYFCWFNVAPDEVVWFKRMRFGGTQLMQVNHSFYVIRELIKKNPECCALVDGKRDTTVYGHARN